MTKNSKKISRPLSLKKSKNILIDAYHRFLSLSKHLEKPQATYVHGMLRELEEHLIHKREKQASDLAKEVHRLFPSLLAKKLPRRVLDFTGALLLALLAAVAIRQMWFELYSIPSGSMRPTFLEDDRLIVSKTSFGINQPLGNSPFVFNPDLVKRGGVVVFSGKDMDIHDSDTMYFKIIPGTKQYIKRMIGKPGDTLYFYGGRVYGLDAAGNNISNELQPTQLNHINHIPFISFEGKPLHISPEASYLQQMNIHVATLHKGRYQITGSMTGKGISKQAHITNYYDLWGFKNYAMCRLLTADQVEKFSKLSIEDLNLEASPLYLELNHHPHLTPPTQRTGNGAPSINSCVTYLPLNEPELKTLFGALYTSRFSLLNGTMFRHGISAHFAKKSPYCPTLVPELKIENGTYEFENGIAYKVFLGGVRKELSPNHPLREYNTALLQQLFNIGIEFDTRLQPTSNQQYYLPSRFAFYRDGNLYVMGKPLLSESSDALQKFLSQENAKKASSTPQRPYEPFIDNGQPSEELIKNYGVTVPAGHYLVLGDNYASSGDSRDFGFVPANNLRGAPDAIIWPPAISGPSRLGRPNQPTYPFFTTPRLTIWALAASMTATWLIVQKRRRRLPLKFPPL